MTRLLVLALALVATVRAADLYSCDFGDELNVAFNQYAPDCGTEVPYSTAHYIEAPIIKYDQASDDTFYVVAMIDPDAPSADDPTYREVRHFLVGNVNGSTLRDVGMFDENTNTVLSPFLNPSPPEGSGYHRYVQHVYSQGPATIDFEPVTDDVLGFNLTAFAVQYDLGDPVGSNYFMTQYECSSSMAQCGGGSTAEAPICCNDAADSCFEQNAYYYQCLAACPDEDNWACNDA